MAPVVQFALDFATTGSVELHTDFTRMDKKIELGLELMGMRTMCALYCRTTEMNRQQSANSAVCHSCRNVSKIGLT